MKSDVRIFPDRVQITRVFDAPRPLVFSYWAQPDKLSLWSGCKDATSVEVAADFRVGGRFSHQMTIKGAGQHAFSRHIRGNNRAREDRLLCESRPGHHPRHHSVL